MTHIFGYIRVSLDDQNPARQKESLANQCARFFIYFASGKDTKRPELSRILDEVRYGDMVFRHCRDSLGRSLNDLLRLTEERTQRGVTLQSIKGRAALRRWRERHEHIETHPNARWRYRRVQA